MNNLSYHLILINSSLRILTDQIDNLCECLEQHIDGGNYRGRIGACSQRVVNSSKPTLAKVSVDPPSVLRPGMHARGRSSFAEASADPPSVLRRDMQANEKQPIQKIVYDKIKRTRKGVGFMQIQKDTGFNQKQIANAIYKLKERNMIMTIKRGIYVKKK